MTIKNKIKELVELQRQLKNQRKSVHIVGQRTISARDAANQHRWTREILREHYHAYATLRGRVQDEIITDDYVAVDQQRVDALIELYTTNQVEQWIKQG